MLLYERRVIDMKFKRVTFTVLANTPGWFVDEAFKKGLMTTVRPDIMAKLFERDYKCNVIVYGLNKLVDDFIKYVEEQSFDVSIKKIEEIGSE